MEGVREVEFENEFEGLGSTEEEGGYVEESKLNRMGDSEKLTIRVERSEEGGAEGQEGEEEEDDFEPNEFDLDGEGAACCVIL